MLRMILSILLVMAFAVPALAQDEPRLALLIGNEDYPAEPGRLRRPHSDVETLGAALERAGFAVVIERDANAASIRGAVSAFAGRLENAGADAVGFFYYAGHGAVALSDGRRRNFMLPAGVTVASAADVALSGVRLDIAIDAMENAGAASLFVVYDACRNSYLRSSGDRGIAVERTRGGLLLAMSTMADATTPDDGAYAIALADQIGRSGQSAEVAFINASRAVGAGRPRDQLPTVSPSLIQPFCFLSCNRDDAAAIEIAATTPASSVDQIIFNAAETPCEYAAFVRDYADSPYAFLARQRAGSTPPCDEAPAEGDDATTDTAAAEEADALADTVREAQRLLAEMGYEPGPADGQPGSRTLAAVRAFRAALELTLGETIDEDLLTDLRSAQRLNHRAPTPESTPDADEDGADGEVIEARITEPPSAPAATSRAPGTVFRDSLRSGGQGPEMVVVPAGSFTMGSPASETGRGGDEGPQRTVTIPRAFAVGRTEVTRGEFEAFVRVTGHSAGNSCHTFEGGSWSLRDGRNWRAPGFSQSDAHPVVCVSWNDAQEYVRWLSLQTGATYRLLSEAEWEYAARARTQTAYPWGGSASHERANYGADRCCSGLASGSDRWVNTAPVSSFPANTFGLHDMIGNVWQWVEDCYADSYSGGPTNGSARTSGDCSRRVLRGGSWSNSPLLLRSALRRRRDPSDRLDYIGFRLARTL